MRPGCVVAFSENDDDPNEEEYAVCVVEVYNKAQSDAANVAAAVGRAVVKDVGLRPKRIVCVAERSILKTTSGKIRRRATKDALRDGVLPIIFDSMPPKSRRRTTNVVTSSEEQPSSFLGSLVSWFTPARTSADQQGVPPQGDDDAPETFLDATFRDAVAEVRRRSDASSSSSSFPEAKPDDMDLSSGEAMIHRLGAEVAALFSDDDEKPREDAAVRDLLREMEVDEAEAVLSGCVLPSFGAFVTTVVEELVKVPAIVEAAAVLERRQERRVPKEATSDVVLAVRYCYALDRCLRHAARDGDFFPAIYRRLQKRVKDDAQGWMSRFELMKRNAITRVADHAVDYLHAWGKQEDVDAETSAPPPREKASFGVILTENIVMAALEDMAEGFNENARTGWDLAFWGQQSELSEVVRSPALPGATSIITVAPSTRDWVHTYLLWNLVFGWGEPRPVLFHAAKLLTPSLLALMNFDPALFMLQRCMTLTIHSSFISYSPAFARYDGHYDTRSPRDVAALGDMVRRRWTDSLGGDDNTEDDDLVRSLEASFAKVTRTQLDEYLKGMSADAFAKDTWLGDIEAQVRGMIDDEPNPALIIARIVGDSDDSRVAGCLARFGDDVVNAARLAYVEDVVVSKARQILDIDAAEEKEARILDRRTVLAERGVTSQDAAMLQPVPKSSLNFYPPRLNFLFSDSRVGCS